MVNIDLQAFGLISHICSTIKADDRFGRLIVLATGRPLDSYRYSSVVVCDCGSAPFVTRNDSLTRGVTIGCGCVRLKRTTKHGVSKHPLWSVHRHMMERCYKPSDPAYPNYGGRGIKVCKRWHDVGNFVHDLASRYSPGLEIDRINNDGDYEPTNVQFVTRTVNSNNRRSVKSVTYNGKTQSLAKWSEELGIPYGTLWTRIAVKKWSVERALSTPSIPAKERMSIARAARVGK